MDGASNGLAALWAEFMAAAEAVEDTDLYVGDRPEWDRQGRLRSSAERRLIDEMKRLGIRAFVADGALRYPTFHEGYGWYEWDDIPLSEIAGLPSAEGAS